MTKRTKTDAALRERARLLSERTQDAFSFDRYGDRAWTRACELLLAAYGDERTVEEILRSKWTRWAADGAKDPNRATPADILRFVKAQGTGAVRALVAEALGETPARPGRARYFNFSAIAEDGTTLSGQDWAADDGGALDALRRSHARKPLVAAYVYDTGTGTLTDVLARVAR